MARFFTSDEHYDHKNIIKLCTRPYTDIDAMTRDIIARHNAKVGVEDTVYHLGDFAFNKRNVEPILKQLNGKHHLISGNHDPCHPVSKKPSNVDLYLSYGFASVQTSAKLTIAGQEVNLCHFPYPEPDSEQDQRYPEHRLPDDGKFLLCGHVHNTFQVRRSMINCGVDAWGMNPVAEDVIIQIMVGSYEPR